MARNHMAPCFAIVFFVIGVTHGKHRMYPLGVNLTRSCESLPKTNLSCAGDIKVSAGSGPTWKASLNSIYGSLESLKGLVNESCIQAIKKSTCLGIPRCERKRQYVDIPTAISACEDARKVCPKPINETEMLDCKAKKEQYESESKNFTKIQCKKIKDSTDTCPDVEYKRVSYPGVNFTEIFLGVKDILQGLKPNLSSDCYSKVKNTVCLVGGTYCSPDEKFAVTYISKEECNKTLQCISDKSYRNEQSYICEELPEESKGVDLPDSDNGASFQSQKTFHIFTAILLFNFLVFL